jgi:hypothetical protein
VHTALAQRAQLAAVQVARETLHELRTEHWDERMAWRKTAREFAARLDRGEYMYPTTRPPLSPASPQAETTHSPMELKLTMERIWSEYSKCSVSDPSTTAAITIRLTKNGTRPGELASQVMSPWVR